MANYIIPTIVHRIQDCALLTESEWANAANGLVKNLHS